MTVLNRARTYARRFGLDVQRWPVDSTASARARLINYQNIDLVLDVGANDGGFGRELRQHGYTGEIVSFEPLATPRERLLAGHPDAKWTVLPYGLADFDGEIDINVAGNDEQSSSVLPMLEKHRVAAPSSRYLSVERCKMRQLDSIWEAYRNRRVLVKIDVQGFERAVLDGAKDSLAHIAGLQLEISYQPLYEGGMLWDEALHRVIDEGFLINRIDPAWTDPRTGVTYQSDAMLFRVAGSTGDQAE